MNPGLVDPQVLLEQATELEPLPTTASRLAELFSRPDWSLEEITSVIRLDQALVVKLLGLANSAMSAPRNRIMVVDQAVMRLGPGMVLSLSLGAAMKGQMEAALPEFGLSEGELWRHSMASALAIEQARHHCRAPIVPEAFASALLHDVGKLVLSRHLDQDSITFMQRATEEGGLTSEDAEREVLSICHAELGSMIARNWNLPETIVAGIQFHHSPLSGSTRLERRLAMQVGLAEAVATTVGATCGDSHGTGEFTPAMAGGLGITLDGFARLCDEVGDRVDEVLSIYG